MSEQDPGSLGARLWRRPRWWLLLGIPLGGALAFAVGLAFSGSVLIGLNHVETLKFCAQSCHEMATPYQEYSQSVHFRNDFGLQAKCADCHVPKAFVARVLRTAGSYDEPLHTLLGTIDTPVKYERHRAEMAQAVWQKLKADDSAECRSCHSFTAMDLTKQPAAAASSHAAAALPNSGETCIDCHKGIAHTLPTGTS